MKPLAPFALLIALSLSACKEDVTSIPDPVELTDEALGHFCQMYVADHAGPKAQIFLKGYDNPLWFSQVSDARAYVLDPDRPAEIVAIYVNDLAQAESWPIMGTGNWITAESASYIIESSQMGGMGTPEALPFTNTAAAEASEITGRIVPWDEIPEDYVRPDMSMMAMSGETDQMEMHE